MKNRYRNLIISTIVLSLQPVLASDGSIIELNSGNFTQTISSSKPTLVKFWASWCGPCRQMAPEFAKASSAYVGKVTFAKVNADNQKALANKYDITSLPTTILFKNGHEVGREAGMYYSNDIKKWAEYSLTH